MLTKSGLPKNKLSPEEIYNLTAERIASVERILKGETVDCRTVLEACKRRRSMNLPNRGFTKSRTMQQVAEIPFEVYVHPEFGKYFQKGMDRHERKKERYRFLKKYPEYRVY